MGKLADEDYYEDDWPEPQKYIISWGLDGERTGEDTVEAYSLEEALEEAQIRSEQAALECAYHRAEPA